MIAATLALSLLLAGPARTPPRWMDLDRSARDRAVDAAAGLPVAQRLSAMSQGFLGTPYAASPLGEGSGKDPDPTLRYDAVDCLTFVETTLALSLAPSAEGVEPLLGRVRYASEQAYDDRNHLMEAQWLPNNVAKGYLREVTLELAGKPLGFAEKKLTPHTWTGKSAVALGLPAARQLQGAFGMPMVPIDRALEVAKRAPTGTVLIVVREDRPLLVTRVSHLGFVIQKKKPMLRHASRTFGKVVDEDLEAFLSRNLGYARWTVSGLAFYEVRAPTAQSPATVEAGKP
ncbi:MAG: N-acetylmuramoyl-L-alanine amidase-like domain-containing protein [Myxococcaceae bacterium]